MRTVILHQNKMAAFSKNIDFSSMSASSPVTGPDTELYWLNPPRSCAVETGEGLKVTPTPGSDFWRKTYTTPPADRATGNCLLRKIPANVKKYCVSTVFSLSLVDQYDQAGLMVYVDNEHWLKAGIEYECGAPNMSCVVTNDQSDWNYFPWTTATDVSIRAEIERYDNVLSCTVQYLCEDGEWRSQRDAPIYIGPGSEVSVGVMTAAPKNKEGTPAMEALFRNLNFK